MRSDERAASRGPGVAGRGRVSCRRSEPQPRPQRKAAVGSSDCAEAVGGGAVGQPPRCPVHVTAGFNFHANFAFNMFDSDGKAENGIEMVAMTMTLFPPFRFHLSFKMVDMPVIILDIDTHDETVKFEHGGTRDETRDVLVKFLDPTGKWYNFLLPDEAEIHNVS